MRTKYDAFVNMDFKAVLVNKGKLLEPFRCQCKANSTFTKIIFCFQFRFISFLLSRSHCPFPFRICP